MPTRQEIAKATAKTLLFLSLLATYAAKYSFQLSTGIAKTTMDASTNMTNYFLDEKLPKLGIGDAIFDKTISGANWTLDQAIKLQKAMKSRLG